MALSPGGPEIAAMSCHFSYRFRISKGAEANCLPSLRCSSMRHMPHNAEAKYSMSGGPQHQLLARQEALQGPARIPNRLRGARVSTYGSDTWWVSIAPRSSGTTLRPETV